MKTWYDVKIARGVYVSNARLEAENQERAFEAALEVLGIPSESVDSAEVEEVVSIVGVAREAVVGAVLIFAIAGAGAVLSAVATWRGL